MESPGHRKKVAILASTALGWGLGLGAAQAAPDIWVGYYAGGSLGYSWGRTDVSAFVSPFTQNNLFTFVFPGGSSSTNLKPNGLVLGGQVGRNWRVAPHWLAGVETDLQWTGQKDSRPSSLFGTTTNCTSGNCSYLNLADITAKLGWFGTLRGRFGFERNDLWFYATGGVAYGEVSISGVSTTSLIDNVSQTVVGAYSTPFSYSQFMVGLAGGVGIEGIIARTNWRWKVEYLHLDLGSVGSANFGGVPVLNINTGRFTDEILRIGFNYQIYSCDPRRC